PSSGQEIVTLTCQGPVGQAVFSPRGGLLAAPENGTRVKVWDSGTGRPQFTLRNTTLVHDVAFSPDGRRLAASCRGHTEIFGSTGEVVLWEMTSGQEVLRFTGQSGFARNLAFSPDGRLLVGASTHEIRIWDATPPARKAGRQPTKRGK